MDYLAYWQACARAPKPASSDCPMRFPPVASSPVISHDKACANRRQQQSFRTANTVIGRLSLLSVLGRGARLPHHGEASLLRMSQPCLPFERTFTRRGHGLLMKWLADAER
jgi:hypothetical protein